MDDLPSAPEGSISEVEKEDSSPTPAPEQQEVTVPTRHDDDEARKIEAAFNTRERTGELKQETHDEGKEMARRSQEVSQPSPQPIQEVPKPIAPIENHTEGLGPQTQPEQQTPPQTGSKLAIVGTVLQQERKILREQLRAKNREGAKKVA